MNTLSTTRVFTNADAWRGTLQTHMPSERPLEISAEAEDFSCAVRMFECEYIQFWDIRSQAHHFERTRAMIGASSPTISLTVQVEGRSGVVQNGHMVTLKPGGHAFVNWDQPYTRLLDSQQRLVSVLFPDHALPERYRTNAELLAQSSEEPSALLYETVTHFLRVWDIVTHPAHTAVLSSALRSVRTAAFSTLFEPQGGPLLAEVQAYILNNLDRPDLGPKEIAEAHFISVRHLYNLFAETRYPVSSWIRQQRLQRVRDDLLDSSLPVSAIGERWGILEPSQLTRAFKREFGVSPIAYRQGKRSAARG